MQFRPTYQNPEFLSVQDITFKFYDKNENFFNQSPANEWASTGVYYTEINIPFFRLPVLVVAFDNIANIELSSTFLDRNSKYRT